MLRVTLFTAPKPCRGEFARIQRNALRSWAELGPTCSVIVLGDEEGLGELAAEVGATHVAGVACTEQGTPLVSELFARAEELSDSQTLCYINADIVLLDDFLPTLERCFDLRPRAMVVGQRHDLDLDGDLAIAPGWQQRLRARASRKGALRGADAIDYFAYPYGGLGPMPPFAIGRPKWDNWTLFRARRRGLALIDATGAITAIHQNHDYSHHPSGREGARLGAEARRNLELSGGELHWFTLEDASHVVCGSRIIRHRHPSPRRRLRQLAALRPAIRPILLLAVRLLDTSFPLRRRLGLTTLRDGDDSTDVKPT